MCQMLASVPLSSKFHGKGDSEGDWRDSMEGCLFHRRKL